MTRDEAIEIVTNIVYWGARGGIEPAKNTASRIVDRLVEKGVLTLGEEPK